MYRQLLENQGDAKWMIERNQELLQKRIKHVRPTICIETPQEFPHLQVNYKKREMEREKQKQIELENLRMRNRVSVIAAARSQLRTVPSVNHSKFESAQRREAERIYRENLALVKRIRGQKSVYDRVKAEKDFQKSESLVRQISSLPYVLAKKTTCPRQLSPLESYSEGGDDGVLFTRTPIAVSCDATTDTRDFTEVPQLKKLSPLPPVNRAGSSTSTRESPRKSKEVQNTKTIHKSIPTDSSEISLDETEEKTEEKSGHDSEDEMEDESEEASLAYSAPITQTNLTAKTNAGVSDQEEDGDNSDNSDNSDDSDDSDDEDEDENDEDEDEKADKDDKDEEDDYEDDEEKDDGDQPTRNTRESAVETENKISESRNQDPQNIQDDVSDEEFDSEADSDHESRLKGKVDESIEAGDNHDNHENHEILEADDESPIEDDDEKASGTSEQVADDTATGDGYVGYNTEPGVDDESKEMEKTKDSARLLEKATREDTDLDDNPPTNISDENHGDDEKEDKSTDNTKTITANSTKALDTNGKGLENTDGPVEEDFEPDEPHEQTSEDEIIVENETAGPDLQDNTDDEKMSDATGDGADTNTENPLPGEEETDVDVEVGPNPEEVLEKDNDGPESKEFEEDDQIGALLSKNERSGEEGCVSMSLGVDASNTDENHDVADETGGLKTPHDVEPDIRAKEQYEDGLEDENSTHADKTETEKLTQDPQEDIKISGSDEIKDQKEGGDASSPVHEKIFDTDKDGGDFLERDNQVGGADPLAGAEPGDESKDFSPTDSNTDAEMIKGEEDKISKNIEDMEANTSAEKHLDDGDDPYVQNSSSPIEEEKKEGIITHKVEEEELGYGDDFEDGPEPVTANEEYGDDGANDYPIDLNKEVKKDRGQGDANVDQNQTEGEANMTIENQYNQDEVEQEKKEPSTHSPPLLNENEMKPQLVDDIPIMHASNIGDGADSVAYETQGPPVDGDEL